MKKKVKDILIKAKDKNTGEEGWIYLEEIGEKLIEVLFGVNEENEIEDERN